MLGGTAGCGDCGHNRVSGRSWARYNWRVAAMCSVTRKRNVGRRECDDTNRVAPAGRVARAKRKCLSSSGKAQQYCNDRADVLKEFP
jgi:hypothetical protein